MLMTITQARTILEIPAVIPAILMVLPATPTALPEILAVPMAPAGIPVNGMTARKITVLAM